MRSYNYIKELFSAILNQSPKIQGRFYISYKYGAQEINSDQLGQVMDEFRTTTKYPLVIMVPPHSQIEYSHKFEEWERFRLKLFFCNTTYYEGYNIKDINPKTKTSLYPVSEVWDDMKIICNSFMRTLAGIQRNNNQSIFRLPSANKALIIPFSITGQDRVSGVVCHFDFDLYTGCYEGDLEDGLIITDYITGQVIYLTSDGYYDLPAGYILSKILILPALVSNIKIGSTIGGDEYFLETPISNSEGKLFITNLIGFKRIYFTGIISNTAIIIYKQPIPNI